MRRIKPHPIRESVSDKEFLEDSLIPIEDRGFKTGVIEGNLAKLDWNFCRRRGCSCQMMWRELQPDPTCDPETPLFISSHEISSHIKREVSGYSYDRGYFLEIKQKDGRRFKISEISKEFQTAFDVAESLGYEIKWFYLRAPSFFMYCKDLASLIRCADERDISGVTVGVVK